MNVRDKDDLMSVGQPLQESIGATGPVRSPARACIGASTRHKVGHLRKGKEEGGRI
jgi:hypothetical protein